MACFSPLPLLQKPLVACNESFWERADTLRMTTRRCLLPTLRNRPEGRGLTQCGLDDF